MKTEKRTVIVLGNGFDMALGMKTSYKSFRKSRFWPFKNSKDGLAYFLNLKTEKNNWFDLEQLLAEYAEQKYKEHDNSFCELDKENFFILSERLKEFIADRENRVRISRKNKIITKFIDILLEYNEQYNPFDHETIIFSFNYTDLNTLITKVTGRVSNIDYYHIHGSIKNNDIIIGVDDAVKFDPKYDFLRKVSNPSYHSSILFNSLIHADDVIVFGHSLGKNDYHFFQHFFEIHSDVKKIKPDEDCSTTIFTKDQQSRMDILHNLRMMNGSKNNQLFALNNLKFIFTEGDKSTFYQWLDDIYIEDSAREDFKDDEYMEILHQLLEELPKSLSSRLGELDEREILTEIRKDFLRNYLRDRLNEKWQSIMQGDSQIADIQP